MQWDLGDFKIRPWQKGDEDKFVIHANNRKVWRNLRDIFPHPYTYDDAKEWIDLATGPLKDTNFAIEIDGKVVGGIGLNPQKDVYKKSGEIGYWLGEEYWNRGIITKAVKVVAEWGLNDLGLVRIYAPVFGWNMASMRVLEKNGFQKEGALRKAVFKDGQITDSVMYAKVKE